MQARCASARAWAACAATSPSPPSTPSCPASPAGRPSRAAEPDDLGRVCYSGAMRHLPLAAAAVITAACASSQMEVKEPTMAADPLAQLSARLEQFAPAPLTTDVSTLPDDERRALSAIIEACALLDPVFDRQAWARYPEHRARLAEDTSPLGQVKLQYFDVMRGPWDRQDHFAPFAIDSAHPKGAGFYPEDLTAEAFNAYVAAHPDEKEALESLFTVVRRDGDRLVPVWYSEAYQAWLVPAADKLRAAAALTENQSLRAFLLARADAFASNDYYASDKAWMDLDSRVEVTIGPYETYEDELLGLKASFECFVTVSDPEASAKLAGYKALLPAMEGHLPVPDEVKTVRGAESPIRVVDVVYTSGDARKSVQTIAFNLPNDERVRKEKGAKKVMLRNIIETKFDRILRPIAEQILDPEQLGLLSAQAFFNETLFHELSHSLGPAFTQQGADKVEVRMALQASYSPLEEAKADVMGAYNILFMIDQGHFAPDLRSKLLVSYFIGLFRSVRFGVAEAHGKGAALQINRFLEEGAARFDAEAGKFTVDEAKLEASITKLVHDIVMIQHRGDKAGADALLAEYGKVSEPMAAGLGQLGQIPVDIRPEYPLAAKER